MAENKTISLNISERLSALSILNEFKGNLETLAVVLDDVKQFTITDEEWEKSERKILPDGEGSVKWTWDNEKAGNKDISLSKTTADVILKDIERRDKAGEFTISDRPYIALKEKLS